MTAIDYYDMENNIYFQEINDIEKLFSWIFREMS